MNSSLPPRSVAGETLIAVLPSISPLEESGGCRASPAETREPFRTRARPSRQDQALRGLLEATHTTAMAVRVIAILPATVARAGFPAGAVEILRGTTVHTRAVPSALGAAEIHVPRVAYADGIGWYRAHHQGHDYEERLHRSAHH